MNEAAVQQLIRLESSRRGTPLLRNNVGACYDDTGRLIRYGLGNDSKKINDVRKSSDLIGIWPVRVTQEMVGSVHGLFFAVECKPTGWTMRNGDVRAVAQKAFGEWVRDKGGIFTFATKIEDVWK